ncbi:MAG: imidazole glycerol phosphate synthase subunit HisF [Firmicutes bacterium]|nr:imidazole glycerol phosphate synthase subunit HisF [Bacillota bacterium]
MLMPRIIPCLDVRHGRVVKGINFLDLVDSGDPVDLARQYNQDGADELVWLDIAATVEELDLSYRLIARAREQLSIPLTVGGGIRRLDHVAALLAHGADKVSVNSYALEDPDIITQIASRWGSQCVVTAVDAKWEDGSYRVYKNGGRVRTPWELGDWLQEAERRGAGEFLLTSMDADGTRQGYDLPMLRYAMQNVSRPIIASGGAGSVQHVAEALAQGQHAVLLASLLHQGHLRITQLKQNLRQQGVNVRCP